MKIINDLFPWTFYKQISVRTDLSSNDIAKLLSEEIAEPTKSLFDQTPIIGNKFYMGEVSNQGFEIRRIIYTRNSFMPVIYGKFIPEPSKTRVQVSITLHPLIIIFSALLCAPPVLAILFLLVGSIIDIPENLVLIPLAVIPFSMLVIYYFFALILFSSEAISAEKYIMSFLGRLAS